jgi:hypothetical protein
MGDHTFEASEGGGGWPADLGRSAGCWTWTAMSSRWHEERGEERVFTLCSSSVLVLLRVLVSTHVCAKCACSVYNACMLRVILAQNMLRVLCYA